MGRNEKGKYRPLIDSYEFDIPTLHSHTVAISVLKSGAMTTVCNHYLSTAPGSRSQPPEACMNCTIPLPYGDCQLSESQGCIRCTGSCPVPEARSPKRLSLHGRCQPSPRIHDACKDLVLDLLLRQLWKFAAYIHPKSGCPPFILSLIHI